MLFYLILFFVPLAFFFFKFDRNTVIIGNKIVFWEISVALLLFAAFRYGIETDYWSYYAIFNKTRSIRSDTVIDPGFKSLIIFYKIIFSRQSYNGFVFFIALLSVGLKYLYFKELKNPFLALAIYVALFYINLEYNVIRQGLALALILIAGNYAMKRRLCPFLIFYFMAGTIHAATWLAIIVYPLCAKRHPLTLFSVGMVIFTVVLIRFVFFNKFLVLANSLAGTLKQPYLYDVMERAYGYLRDETLLSVGFLRRIVVILLFVLLNNKKTINNGYFILYLIGVCLYTLFMGNVVLSTRLSLTFEVFMIPMFADLPLKLNSRNLFCVSVLVLLLFALHIYALTHGGAIPYRSYLPV
jgi:hypothetical protein